jgi:hypothetical protein
MMLIFGFIVIVGTLFIVLFCIAALCQVIAGKPTTISTELRSNPRPKVERYSPAPYRISDIDKLALRTTGKVRIYKRTVSTTEIFIEIDE